MCIYYFNFLDYTCKGLLHSSFAWDQEFSILLHCVFGYICMVLCSYVSVGPGGLKQSQQIRTLTEQYGGGACGGTKEKIFQMLFCYLILEQELGFQESHFKLGLTNFVSFQSIYLFTSISCFKNESSCFEWQEYENKLIWIKEIWIFCYWGLICLRKFVSMKQKKIFALIMNFWMLFIFNNIYQHKSYE